MPVPVHKAFHKELYKRLNKHFGRGKCNSSTTEWKRIIGEDRMNEAIDILKQVSQEYDYYGLVEPLKEQLANSGF